MCGSRKLHCLAGRLQVAVGEHGGREAAGAGGNAACAAPRVTHAIEDKDARARFALHPRLLPLDREILQQVDRVAVALRRRHHQRIA